MKVCETCGKVLEDSEVFNVNSIVQCEECAYPDFAEKSNETTQPFIKQKVTAFGNVSNFWIGILKTFCKITMLIGILVSIIAGIIFIANEEAVIGLIIIVVGIVLSVLSVTVLMVFAEAATDISIVKYYLENKMQ